MFHPRLNPAMAARTLSLASLLALAACGDGGTGPCEIDVGHDYATETGPAEPERSDVFAFGMVLDHACPGSAVSGTFYRDDVGHALTGTVEDGQFTFTATSERASGVSTWRGTLEVVSGGLVLRGRVTHSGAAGFLVFQRVDD